MFCTVITKKTRKQSLGFESRERLDVFQNKLFLPQHVKATLVFHVSITADLIRRDFSPTEVVAVPSGSQSGAGTGLA